MKALLQIAAVLSFGFCLAGGLTLLGRAVLSEANDAFLIQAMGLFFVGMGFFFGPILLAVGSRLSRPRD